MRLNSAFVSIFSFVSTVLSGHLREKDRSWFPTNGTSDGVQYNDQIACAFWERTDGPSITFATATFNALAPSGQHGYAVWVRIDNNEMCPDSWLIAGIVAFVTNNSETIYKAWYEWGKEGPYYSDVTVTPKDVIRAGVTALSPTSSAIMIKNLNSGQVNIHYLNSTRSLCGQGVSWGVFLDHVDDPIPFDTVTITNASAYGPLGSTYKAEGANKMEIKQDNKTVTSVETEGSTITIRHVYE
ncbi:peptidase A4 family-domain-containing protein [Boletus edulis]|uniref:Peptidase A4 family-domain-containing protein n=1 Tax=Boletus edulis BED1 TaxID=1328754 RepID=A0AAD4BLC7_BOLED|nr:peptidase A4 family-domain-containing protein [Boletus edulis]KAF8433758.1 peptidase A4 family-domain-containing protein [Boletus edulis BED1]